MREGASSSEVLRQGQPGPRKRRDETLYRRRRIGFAAGFVIFCVAIVFIVIATTGSGPAPKLGTLNSSSPVVSGALGDHPPFARLGDRNLLLPVRAKDATIIAYTPVDDDQIVLFSPDGERANANALVRFFRGLFSGEPAVRYYVLPGEGRGPTGAILVGAPAGCEVKAPVSGTVTAVTQYKLYGKYDDVQVDIRPEEMSGITFSMLFIEDPAISIGEVVTAGKTTIGKVRECPEDLGKQLSVYTHDSGSHVFMQATEEPVS